MTAKPNLLLITTDTQRWDTLNCMGNPFAHSPHADRLAAEGVMFTQGHTSSPVCGPARSSLITGLHAPIHGVWENGMTRLTHFPTLPDLLKERGHTKKQIAPPTRKRKKLECISTRVFLCPSGRGDRAFTPSP